MSRGLNQYKQLLKKSEPQDLGNYARAHKEIDDLIAADTKSSFERVWEHEYLEASDLSKMASKNTELFLNTAMQSMRFLPEEQANKFYSEHPQLVAKIVKFNPTPFHDSKKVMDDLFTGEISKTNPSVRPMVALASPKLDPELVWIFLNSNSKAITGGYHYISSYMNNNENIWERHGSDIIKGLEDPKSNLSENLKPTDITVPSLSQDQFKKMLEDADPNKNGIDASAIYKRIVRRCISSLETTEEGAIPLRPDVALKFINIIQGQSTETQKEFAKAIPIDMIIKNPQAWKTNPKFAENLSEDPRLDQENLWKLVGQLKQEDLPYTTAYAHQAVNRFEDSHDVESKLGFVLSAPPELQDLALESSRQDFYKDPAFRQYAMQKFRTQRASDLATRRPFTSGIVADSLVSTADNPNEIKMISQLLPSDSDIHKRISAKLKDMGEYDDPEQVSFSFGTGKIRQLRALAEEKGGVISGKDAKAAGFDLQNMGLNPLKDGKGNITAENLTAHIEAMPKHTYGVSHTTYGEENDTEPGRYDDDSAIEEASKAARDYWQEQYADPEPDWEEDFNVAEGDRLPKYEDDPEVSSEENAERKEKYDQDRQQAIDNYSETQHEYWQERQSDLESEYVNNHLDEFAPENNDEKTFQNMQDEQRHSHEPSKVFQLNLTSNQMKQLKQAGAWDTFKDLHDKFSYSGHPYSKGNGLGWVRYTQDPQGGTMIDEIQSDFGQNFVKRLKEQLKRYEEEHGLTQEQRENANNIIEGFEKVPPSHYDTINQVLFQGKHPSEVLHEAFLQHMRNTGNIGKNVHIWDVKPKSALSGQNPEEALPAHMLEGYSKIPKKMGYQPGKYGELKTQKTFEWGGKAYQGNGDITLKGQPTWKIKLTKSTLSQRKFRIGTLNSGQPVFSEFEDEAHESFSPSQHLEAAGILHSHIRRAVKKGLTRAANRYYQQYQKHLHASLGYK